MKMLWKLMTTRPQLNTWDYLWTAVWPCIKDSAACLVCSEPARSHAAPLLHCLHWLMIHECITYKLCIFMFHVYHGTAPEYLTNLCTCCNDHRLQSSTRGDFVVRWTRTRLADSSFTIAGSAAWNSLPARINSRDAFTWLMCTCRLYCIRCIEWRHSKFLWWWWWWWTSSQ